MKTQIRSAILCAAMALAGLAQDADAQSRRVNQALNVINRILLQQARLDNIVTNLSAAELQDLLNRTGALQDSNLDGIPDVMASALSSDACTDLTGQTAEETVTVTPGTETATTGGNVAGTTVGGTTGGATTGVTTGTTTGVTTGVATGTTTAGATTTTTGTVSNIGTGFITINGQTFTLTPTTQFINPNGATSQLPNAFAGQCAVVQGFQPLQTAGAFFQAARIQSVACATLGTDTGTTSTVEGATTGENIVVGSGQSTANVAVKGTAE